MFTITIVFSSIKMFTFLISIFSFYMYNMMPLISLVFHASTIYSSFNFQHTMFNHSPSIKSPASSPRPVDSAMLCADGTNLPQ